MVGECLQILTGHLFKAAVHRVCTSSSARVSAPMLVRGKNQAIIGKVTDRRVDDIQESDRLTEPCAETHHHKTLSTNNVNLPDYSGVTMKMLHNILDLKRKRCAASHSNESSDVDDDGHWVLSAFPTDY